MRKLIFALALGAILIPNHGFTLGLGEIEVNSALNQRLAARIELLSASSEDAESLLIKLATREEFVRAGLDRPMVLASLKFKAVVENGHVYIDVLSPKPIREPFLNFLVEVDWPKGHLIREYTILLDPPSFMGGQQKVATVTGRPVMRESTGSAPLNIQPSAVADDNRPGAESSAPVAREDRVQQQEQVQQQASYTAPSYTAPTDHRIEKGDTAWSLANSMKPDDSVSTQQMMLAMLRLNPEAFIDGNVNGLKRGFILRTPDYADINAISYEEAKAVVNQQNALWREYQQSLSSDKPASAIDENYTETEYSSAVGGMNDESRLSIVSAGGGSSASGEMKDPAEMTTSELREQLSLARERVETERVEKETLKKQVDALSTQVDKMKGLLTIEDNVMAEMQSAGDTSKEQALPVDDADTGKVVEEAITEPTAPVDEQSFNALDALTNIFKDEPSDEENLTMEPPAEENLVVEPAVEAAPEETAPDETAPAAEQVFVDDTDAAMLEAGTETGQEMLNEMEPAYTPPEEHGLVDTLLDNRMVLGGLLVVLLVIGAIVYLIKRRRNASGDDGSSGDDIFNLYEEDALENIADMVEDDSIDDLVSDEEVKASMAIAEAEEEAFDADATMILPSGTDTVVTPAANLQPEEEQDDVLAEADVYLAYGIYQQAEELLENAIKQNPDKDSYRVKLAETYFAGKNTDALAKLGVEMKQRLGNSETPAWTKIAAMGKELCPDEDVFQQAGMAADIDVNDLMPKSPEPMDFDLGGDEGASELDLDFDSPLDELGDDTEFELPSMEETAVISPDETAIMSSDSTSFDELEFDLSETDALEEPTEEEGFSLDIDASELDLETSAADEGLDLGLDLDMDFDMSSDAASESADSSVDFDLDMSSDAAAASESADSSVDFDLDMSVEDGGFDMSMDDASLDLSTDDASLDMSMDDAGLDMMMDAAEGEIDLTSDISDLGLATDDDFGDMDLSEPMDAEEVATKLDLSRAYLDMGDHEGARDILAEVLAGGNADQKKEAEELMALTN